MNILITGGTGFIGEALLPALLEDGHSLFVLSRSHQGESGSGIDYLTRTADISEQVDAVINLAGASIAGKRWTEAYKEEVVSSRLDTTRALGDFFARAGYSPAVWLNASAIGYYGARGDEELSEAASAGDSFSARLCVDWETAAEAAAGTARVCLMRLGVVLDKEAGAYPQMAQPFRLGVANWVGDGKQWLSWIHRTDVVRAMRFLLTQNAMEGPVNLTAPQPVTSRAFCDAMRRVHRTFVALPMPAPVMRVIAGEMADELLITGQCVLPDLLMAAGFTFEHASIDSALQAIEA